MDVVEMKLAGDCIEDACNEQVISTGSSDTYNIFGDPEILPRVGDQYQVEIPPLVTQPDALWLKDNSADARSSTYVPIDFLMGLPVSTMWINLRVETNLEHELVGSPGNSTDASKNSDSVKSECLKENKLLLEISNMNPKVEPVDVTPDDVRNLGELEDLVSQQEMKIKVHQKLQGQAYCAVPGSVGDTWNDIEESSFVLGLYIFGKNLVQVEKFVSSKRMGDILSFYYGRFYSSERYHRWSECRKKKRRRCIYGKRIFTGLRQQELLSRLLPNISEESQNILLEVSKTFGDGKMLLEKYVFSLKAVVGLNALVNAVGIGKGKEDLTGIAVEPLKANQVVPFRPEIPVGRACSALTTLEIIDFLTGNYRLSKARSNDLFWEAVWPRLLARGWHSEQPKNQVYVAGSKHSLVFLTPGVKKFSRGKLVKGEHYFDSVTDILSKVASEPRLLELEIGVAKGESNKEENGWIYRTKSERDDFSNQQGHCYLKSRVLNCCSDTRKFTVVDTSLADGETCNVRDLRKLPVEIDISNSCSHSEESDKSDVETSTKFRNETDSAEASCFDKIDNFKHTLIPFDVGVSSGSNPFKEMFSVNGQCQAGLQVISEHQETKVYDGMQARKTVKNQTAQRRKFYDKSHLVPVKKRHREFTACNQKETISSVMNVGSRLKQGEANCCGGNPDVSAEIPSDRVHQCKQKLPCPCSSFKSSATITSEGIVSSTIAKHPCEEPHARTLIDLNLPVSDRETHEPFTLGITERQHQTSIQQEDTSHQDASVFVSSSELQPNTNGRRQSTRNRPLTTKALEALACGFLSTKHKRKLKVSFSEEDPMSRHRHRAHGRVRTTEAQGDGNVYLNTERRENGACNNNGSMEQTSGLTQIEIS